MMGTSNGADKEVRILMGKIGTDGIRVKRGTEFSEGDGNGISVDRERRGGGKHGAGSISGNEGPGSLEAQTAGVLSPGKLLASYDRS